jgi:hypothetical protein
MSALITADPLALHILMNDELYLFEEHSATAGAPAAAQAQQLAEVPVPATLFVCLGENRRFLLLLVDEPGEEFASAATLESLKKILAGLKMTMEDVALLNIARYPGTPFSQLRAWFACSRAVLFGIDPASLALPAIASNEIAVIDSMRLLTTFGFAEMNTHDQKKRVFWNEMKKL